MTERRQAMDAALVLPGTYEDAPFHDPNWTTARRLDNGKIFLCSFERQGKIWINVKVAPGWAEALCAAFEAIVPAYHMNKRHWVSIILDDTVSDEQIERMIADSYDLTGKRLDKR